MEVNPINTFNQIYVVMVKNLPISAGSQPTAGKAQFIPALMLLLYHYLWDWPMTKAKLRICEKNFFKYQYKSCEWIDLTITTH
jgi:hypothetical protein